MKRHSITLLLLAMLPVLALVGCGRAARSGSSRASAETPWLEKSDLFVSGQGGYHTYRIPALLHTSRGTLLAFCEGRKNSARDYGDIDLLLRRSFDGGRTWGPVQVLVDAGPDTCGNPAPVEDARTGRIFLLTNRNLGERGERDIKRENAPRTVWVSHSDDQGATWSEPREITRDVKRESWRWYATGPGHGIQLSSGRLLIACDHTDVDVPGQPSRSHVIYSDDGGQSWRIGGVLGDRVNECLAAEMADGRLYLNMRSYRGMNLRAFAWSTDGGLSWSGVAHDPALVEPVCQAGLYAWKHGRGRTRVLFSNPADERRRVRLTVRLSEDECATWGVSRVLHEGPTAYSDLGRLPEGTLLCLFENGDAMPYERITLARFNLAWLRGR